MMRRAWLTALVFAAPSLVSAAPPVEFNRDVRPILSDACFACHGPDKGKRKADLRLDTEEGARSVVKAGKPDDSELYKRIIDHDKSRIMPPAKSGKSVTPVQVATLKRWIEQGAKWQAHWSFIAQVRPSLPSVADGKWGRNAIDAFILDRLSHEGLAPSTEADARTLIRRLYFDLLGLPPSAEEVDAFVKDHSAAAYEALVTKLLGSKHFGERMAMGWLDQVRFADTCGYHSDNHRDLYLYRDYVIAAYNANKPFDQFTREQLAGDLLPGATSEQRIASGYNRLLQTTEEGGAQPKEYTAKYAADRVRNASGVWLGLTMGCCECHSHKFDPITIKEFYQFGAFFADVREAAVGRQPETKITPPELSAKLASIDEQITALRKPSDPGLADAQKRWEAAELARLATTTARSDWHPVRPTKLTSAGKQTLTIQEDNSVLASGVNPIQDTYTVVIPAQRETITALRLATLTHPSLTDGSLSRANGNFVLTGIEVTLQEGKKTTPVKLAKAVADFSQDRYPVANLLTPGGKGWASDGHKRKANVAAAFVFDKPIKGGPGKTLTVKLIHQSVFPQHNIGRFRLDLSSAADPSPGEKASLREELVVALKTESSKRTPVQKEALAAHFRSIAPELEPVRRKIEALTKERDALIAAMPQTLVSDSMPMPRMMRILARGNWLDDSGEIVAPGTPASLPPLGVKGRRATRLDLASWLMATENPLTARVAVNRLWKQFFGQGLVTTADDFGAQGAPPTHPELLDWLAVEFREHKWDVKHIVKLLVMSSTYRQTSIAPESLRARDPYNRLLARQSRFRLDAELVRDNALAVSGLLSEKAGGASVKPYQPEGYWQYLNFPTRTYVADTGENQYRRGMYTYWQRTFPHPSLTAFDAPSREECTVERPRSNTPLQALVLLNDPTFVESARVLAERALASSNVDAARLEWTFRRVLNRSPRPEEAKLLLDLVKTHRAQYQADSPAVAKLIAVGQHPVGKDVDRVALAAWTSVARVLLNLHETITRE
jgi:Protein of unknown function (DUF1553)/Protein of unknown function (DUF1549)/Planctomycete cytochrome C